VGRLLGDPEVWDDSPSRPRVLVRGLVGLAVGLVAGGLVALAVVPRPAAPPPEVAAPPPEDLGTTVVLVTHDAEVAAAMDRTVTIRDGRVSAEGRGGTEYAMVGPTGSLHLPADALAVLPPGERVTVEVEPDRVVLRPTDRRSAGEAQEAGTP
jgi:hypothetical protein